MSVKQKHKGQGQGESKGQGKGKGVTWHNNDDHDNHDNDDANDAAADDEVEDEDGDEDGSAFDQDQDSSKSHGSAASDPTDSAAATPSALALVAESTVPPQRWLTSILRDPPPAPPPDPYDENIRDQQWQATKPHQRVDYRFGYVLLVPICYWLFAIHAHKYSHTLTHPCTHPMLTYRTISLSMYHQLRVTGSSPLHQRYRHRARQRHSLGRAGGAS